MYNNSSHYLSIIESFFKRRSNTIKNRLITKQKNQDLYKVKKIFWLKELSQSTEVNSYKVFYL